MEEPLISESRKPALKKLIESKLNLDELHPLPLYIELIEKQMENQDQKFECFKVLRAHLLPLTNCAFNKSGDK